jgi:hypothetical protein
MNKFKSLPWTQILLFLLLAATIANYFETRRTERLIGSLYVALEVTDQHANDGLEKMNKSLDELSETIEQMAQAQDCMAYHRIPCTR